MSLNKEKILIFNSDDFGHSHPFNMGVYKGIKTGVLVTSCVLANMEGYNEAVSLISDLKNVKFGIHLNLIEGKSVTEANFLVDSKNNFNLSYIDILKKSNDIDFLNSVEFEFRAQIERILSDFEINHINSHVHIHSIPNIFKIVCKLAEEYKIPYIRTQFEKPYIVKNLKKNLNLKYPINLIKRGLLNYFTLQNKKFLPKNFLTNDYLLGVTYTGFMDKNAVLEGLKAIEEGVVELIIHPAYYENEILKPYNYNEFKITEDDNILDEIKKLGFKLSDCSIQEKEVEDYGKNFK